MKHILLAWIGLTDLKSIGQAEPEKHGPIARALSAFSFDQVILLDSYSQSKEIDVKNYMQWLKNYIEGLQYKPHITKELKPLNPTHHEAIYIACVDIVNKIQKDSPDAELTFHLSPGTPAMHTVWVILAKTLFKAKLIQSSPEEGVKEATIPFNISAEFVPGLIQRSQEQLQKVIAGNPTGKETFASINYSSQVMKEVVEQAKQCSISTLPVLILGESGTGKELFARAIHVATYYEKIEKKIPTPFIPVNCGAIPENLMETEFFGSVPGAFTGAKDHTGYFEQANGGTIFLDEIGELPLYMQVKLLRVLQSDKVVKIDKTSLEIKVINVTRVGDTIPKELKVRVIAATNRNLQEEVSQGRFREDLYYRLTYFIIKIPPLRERQGELAPLIDTLLEKIKDENNIIPQEKHLSPEAKNYLYTYSWPGNVRQLQSVLARAAFFSTLDRISAEDVEKALSIAIPQSTAQINPSQFSTINDTSNISNLISQIVQKHLEQALANMNVKSQHIPKINAVSNQGNIKIINFSHPLTEKQLDKIKELSGQTIGQIIDIKTQLDPHQPFIEQVQKLLESIDVSPQEWQTSSLLLNLPSLNAITASLLTELHGRMGYFPSILRLRPIINSTPPQFEVAEILNLQAIRDLARQKR